MLKRNRQRSNKRYYRKNKDWFKEYYKEKKVFTMKQQEVRKSLFKNFSYENEVGHRVVIKQDVVGRYFYYVVIDSKMFYCSDKYNTISHCLNDAVEAI